MKPEPPPLRVGKPCPKQWESMSGDGWRRFCEHCQLHVHNLSEMSRGEREDFVIESAGKACIAYELRRDGSMVTPSFWRGVLRPLQRIRYSAFAVLAALLPFFLPACASRRVLGKMASLPPSQPPDASVENNGPMMLGRPMPPGQTEHHP